MLKSGKLNIEKYFRFDFVMKLVDLKDNPQKLVPVKNKRIHSNQDFCFNLKDQIFLMDTLQSIVFGHSIFRSAWHRVPVPNL